MLNLLLQTVPDPTDVIKAATSAGWAYGALCFVMLVSFVGLAWLVRTNYLQAGQRESRMAQRIDKLEENQTTVLLGLVRETKQALDNNTAATNMLVVKFEALATELSERPCLEERKRTKQMVA